MNSLRMGGPMGGMLGGAPAPAADLNPEVTYAAQLEQLQARRCPPDLQLLLCWDGTVSAPLSWHARANTAPSRARGKGTAVGQAHTGRAHCVGSPQKGLG